MSDPPAPDLGAQDPHLAELYRILARCVGTYQSIALSPQDAAAWLQHVDAQAARLARVTQESNRLELLVSEWWRTAETAESERDAQAAQLADAERRASVVVGWCLECEQYERLLVCCQECQDAQAARLAAQQPVMDAVFQLSMYSRETVDAGVRRIVETLGDYEEWLLTTARPGPPSPSPS